MGRPAEGWKLRLKHGIWQVRFTVNGRQIDCPTGKREHEYEAAAALAPGIYAREIQNPRPARTKVAARSEGLLKAAEQWLEAEETLRSEETSATYALYAKAHWEPFFGGVDQITLPKCEAYRAYRLGKVDAESVRKELGALRAFARWLKLPFEVPGVPHRVQGTPVASHWKGSQELSPAECERVLRVLPSPAKERYTVAYETSLRPATLDKLSVPEHWRKGSRYLEIPPKLDKARMGRPVPLSDRAIAALRKVAPKQGLIFGTNRHRKLVKAAGMKAIKGERGRRFVPTDLRAAAGTHWLEQGGNLPGVQYLMGHARATTTDRYAKPSLRAAEAVLRRGRRRKTG